MNPTGFGIVLFLVIFFLFCTWINTTPKDMKMTDGHIYKWFPAHYAHDPECSACKAALQEKK